MTTTIPAALVEGVRAELKRLIEEPDLDKNLLSIEQIVHRTRELFVAFKAPAARPRRNAKMYLSSPGYDSDDGEAMMSDPYGNLAPNPETFGAKTLREIMALVPSLLQAQRETPQALVNAIADARRAGLADVSAELEQRLLNKKLDGARPVLEAPPAIMPKPIDEVAAAVGLATATAIGVNGNGKSPDFSNFGEDEHEHDNV